MKIIFWIARIFGWLVIAFGAVTGFFAAMAPGILEANPALALQYPHLGEAATQGLPQRLWFPVCIVFAGALISGLAADAIKKGQAVTGWVSVGLAGFFAFGVAILSSIVGQADAPVQIPLEIDEAGRLTLDGRPMTSNPTAELSPGPQNVSRPDDPDNVRLVDLMHEAEARQGFQSEKTIYSVNAGSIDRLGPPTRHQDLSQAIPIYAVDVIGERADFVRRGDLTGWIAEFEQDAHRGYGTLTGGRGQCEGKLIYNGRFKLRRAVIQGLTAYRTDWIVDRHCAIWTVDFNTCELIRCARRDYEGIEGAQGNFLVIGRTPAERLHQILVNGG